MSKMNKFTMGFLVVIVVSFCGYSINSTVVDSNIKIKNLQQTTQKLETENNQRKNKTSELKLSLQKLKLEVQKNKVALVKNIKVSPSYGYLKSVTVRVIGTTWNDYNEEIGWTGTGVIVKIENNNTYILTNAHVAGSFQKDPIIFIRHNFEYIETEIISYHSTSDLALLRVKQKLKNKKAIRGLNSGKPQDKVYTVGNHLGRPYIYGEGVFAGYDEDILLIQIPIASGNSGSGVFNDRGELIGIFYAVNYVSTFCLDNAHGLAVSSDDIKPFLKRLGMLPKGE